MSRQPHIQCKTCRQAYPREELSATTRCSACVAAAEAREAARAERNAGARDMLLAGYRLDQIRARFGAKGTWVDHLLGDMSREQKAQRARRMEERAAEEARGQRCFAVPTGSGHGFTYGRLDGNEVIVAAVKARTGLDPWDYEVGQPKRARRASAA